MISAIFSLLWANTLLALNSELDSFKGKNLGVVLIHGYSNLFPNESYQSEKYSEFYWTGWTTGNSNIKSWTEEFEERGMPIEHIPWNTLKRLDPDHQETQFYQLVDRFKSIVDSGHCGELDNEGELIDPDAGCVIFTHSTGGLVLDLLLTRAMDSEGTSDDYSRIAKATVLAVPIASAAGGVTFASIAVDLFNGMCDIPLVDVGIEAAVNVLMPTVSCSKPDELGTTYDLIPSVARSINHASETTVPYLMIAGNGDLAGNIVPAIYKGYGIAQDLDVFNLFGLDVDVKVGTTDGLVAMHSACGSQTYGAFQSCDPGMSADGDLKPQAAPGSRYPNHFPVLMTQEGHLAQTKPCFLNISDTFQCSSSMTESLIRSKQSDMILSNLSEKIKTETITQRICVKKWWRFCIDYDNVQVGTKNVKRIVKNSGAKHLSSVVVGGLFD